MALFDTDYGINESPPDNTEITTMLLYFSKEELKEFKKLCKEAMKREMPETFQEKGNVSDLLLTIMRRYANAQA